MPGISLAEQVVRYTGPIERLAQTLYMRPTGADRGQIFSDLVRLLAELDRLAERRIDKTTYEHYRRARTDADNLCIPVGRRSEDL